MKKWILCLLTILLAVALFTMPASADSVGTVITPTGCALAFEGAIAYNVYFSADVF